MLHTATDQIDAIFVRPSHIGQGIGRKMLDFLEHLARSHGLTSLKLDATLNAAPFYRRCGWIGDELVASFSGSSNWSVIRAGNGFAIGEGRSVRVQISGFSE
jgi:GNAT superfamily N-acetyltransferase